jgi:uncharacterized lipoprotein YddW (UPF0748 family)
MSRQKKEPSGCGCANIPVSLILVILGGGYWLFTQRANLNVSKFLPNNQQINIPFLNPIKTASPTSIPALAMASPAPWGIAPHPPNPVPSQPQTTTSLGRVWEKKVIRGIYLSRYLATNNADEDTIRQRVRFYHAQGFNTILQGVWGNGCTMYQSKVTERSLGAKSCPNKFQDQWIDWLIDEAHKQGMQVHAYFERGIKIDKNSPIFDLAIAHRWVVPGVDRTYPGIEHYVLDVELPDVANLFKNMLVEFVQRYPKIDAVQWDDYLGYYAELPGKVDRTSNLTHFVQQMVAVTKQANPAVSFDICHHNPYWAKRYFAADWTNWHVDRVFIQVYNNANFSEELNYAKNYAGIALGDNQLQQRLKEATNNAEIKSILVFPLSGNPEATAIQLKGILQNNN